MADKITTDHIWYTDDGKMVNVGFTRSFLDRMAECWHVMPAHTSRVREKSPLITIESNEEMFSIPSPITGNIRNFSDKASNFPDRLVETDVICQIVRGEAAKVGAKTKAVPMPDQMFNPFEVAPTPRPPQPETNTEGFTRHQVDLLNAIADNDTRNRVRANIQRVRAEQQVNEVRAILRPQTVAAVPAQPWPFPADGEVVRQGFRNFNNTREGN